MPTYLLPFTSSETTLERAGGKGTNLAALARAGFAVPSGLIVTTDAYRAFLRVNRLADTILSLARRVDPADPTSLETLSAEIRSRFDQGEWPADVADAVRAGYADLNAARTPGAENLTALPVAVRSSATAEDLPGLAFAGQQETYLNVIGEAALLDAVIKCWGSLWTARAMAYRARNQIAPDSLALAVVVQEMVASEASGVLFTANPLTGRRDETVIDASYGLGEAIVSGQVMPDHYVVNPREGTIVERALGDKALAIVPRAGGGTESIVPEAPQRQALPDAAILELAQTASRVADHFGSPQDIEWAWAHGRLYLLQSRPITSLYPLPEKHGDGLRVYVSVNALQGVVDPLTPLGSDALEFIGGGIVQTLRLPASVHQVLGSAGGRLFTDVTGLARDARLRHGLLAFLARGDPGARQAIAELIAAGRIPTTHTFSVRRLLNPGILSHPVPRRVIAALRTPQPALTRALAEAEACRLELQSHVHPAGDPLTAMDTLEQDAPRAIAGIALPLFPLILLSFVLLAQVDRWLVAWLGVKPGAAIALLRGISGNVTTAMDLDLWALAQAIRADPAASTSFRATPVDALAGAYREGTLPAVAQQGLTRFLDEYGARGVGEIDLGRPRWRDDPAPLLQTLRNYLDQEDPAAAPDRIVERGAAEADRLAADYVARVRRMRGGWLRARLLRGIIDRMRLFQTARETPKFSLVRWLSTFRATLQSAGREMAASGALEHGEDIFFVPLETLRHSGGGGGVDLKGVVAARRAEYERERARKQIPRVLLSTGEAFYSGVADSSASADELVGDPVSPGVAEGRVRVVLDPRGVRLAPGEILVCPATDPAWTPLFLTAGGLVMEIGGLATHGAVVAREYGLPAIVGVQQATTRLRTGQRVRVDGSRGRVTVL